MNIPQYIIDITQNDNVLINRYIKMHPNELFKEYDFSIYIDGNIKIISTLSSLINQVGENTGLALHRHSIRNCIFEEIEACKTLKKGNYEKMKIQADRYRNEGFPSKFGLLECNVIVSNLNNINSKIILNEWWNEFKYSDSRRDQIVLPYILWKKGFSIKDIGNLGENIYYNPKFRIDGRHNKK